MPPRADAPPLRHALSHLGIRTADPAASPRKLQKPRQAPPRAQSYLSVSCSVAPDDCSGSGGSISSGSGGGSGGDGSGGTSASSSGCTDSIDDYVNPLESGPRWLLAARAIALRTAASIGSGLFGWLYTPSRTVWLDTHVRLRPAHGAEAPPGRIEVVIWDPPGAAAAESAVEEQEPAAAPVQRRRRPAVINFHGGGFFLGLGTDDAVWATMAARELDAVVLSVNYRLAPTFAFPVPVEDCADMILQITDRADELGIDPDRIVLSGFSAGGNLCLASWIVLQTPERWGYTIVPPADAARAPAPAPAPAVPRIAGMALFYPGLDVTVSRARKRLTCSRPDLTLPKFMTDIIDAGYMYPPLAASAAARADPRLSPGLMDDGLVDQLPPVHLCVCEYDMLLVEAEVFAERLRLRGRLASLRVVAGERHAWDKPPPLAPKESAVEEYAEAIASLRIALEAEDARAARAG